MSIYESIKSAIIDYFFRFWQSIRNPQININNTNNHDVIDDIHDSQSLEPQSIPDKDPDPDQQKFPNVFDEIKNCPICLERIDTDQIKTSCEHEFHKQCLHNWINEADHNDCPLCRTNLSYLKKDQISIERQYQHNTNVHINNDQPQHQLQQWNDHQASRLNSFYGLPNRGTYQSNPYGLQTSLDYAPYPF